MKQSIHKLDYDTINKIAAGEVVERPASIVKELVENSIDAGATRIEVHLYNGGKTKIQVIDNASGIAEEDLALAVERHATSKIRDAGDLFNIASMGFRGEALASIASVSYFTISSKTEQVANGSTMHNINGNWQSKPYHGANGTMIMVENLFHSIPARRQFLKSDSAELGACQDLLQSIALAHPYLGIKLTHNDKNLLDLPPLSKNLPRQNLYRERLIALFGDDLGKQLLYINGETETAKIFGFISPPNHDKATSKWIHLFVNQRLIKDKTLNFAVTRGYHSHLMKGRYPVAILFIETDPTLIDVNVHPAKTEIRFQYLADVQNLIAQSIRTSLRQGEWSAAPSLLDLDSDPGETKPLSHNYPSSNSPSSLSMFAKETMARPRSPSSPDSHGAKNIQPPSKLGEKVKEQTIPWRDLSYLGSFARCYLIFEHQENMLIIDQHAFHERILYERLMRDQDLQLEASTLMIPDVLIMNPREIEVLDHLQAQLSKLGFAYKILDHRQIELNTIPKLIIHRSPETLLGELVEKYEHDRGQASPESWLGDMLATIACHSAVRSGEELAEQDLRILLNEAQSVDFYLNCPHGRPVFKWFSREQVGAWFAR